MRALLQEAIAALPTPRSTRSSDPLNLYESPNSCADTGQITMMRGFGTYETNYDLKRVDKYNLATKYNNRAGTLNYRLWGTSSWSTLTATTMNGVIAHAANLTQNYGWTLITYQTNQWRKKWVYASPSETYNENMNFGLTRQNTDSVAIDPASGKAIWVFAVDYDGDNLDYEICYRTSTDFGQTFDSTHYCPNGGYTTNRDRLVSGFDPRTKMFILSWISDGTRSLTFYTLPAPGSSTPSAYTQWSGDSAWFGSSIACKNVAMGCRIAWGDTSSNACFKWAEAEISTTGNVTAGVVRTNCYLQHDSPSIAYYQQEDMFYRVFTLNNGGSFAARMAATGTVWTGIADLYNSNVFHSAGMLATERFCIFGCTGNLKGWLVRY